MEATVPQTFSPPRLRVQLEATLGEDELAAWSDEDLDALLHSQKRPPRLLPGRDVG
jgi:hypothetical protein